MIRIKYVFTSSLILGLGVVQAQILTVDSAFALLERRNPDIRQAYLQADLVQQDLRDAKNAWWPSVSLGVSHNYNMGLAFDQVAGQLVTGNKWSNTANANIGTSATLFQGFAKRDNMRSAQLAVQSKEVELKQLYQSLQIAMLGYFFDVLSNKELLQEATQQLRYVQEQLAQEKIQFDLGVKTLVDFSLAENQVAIAELNVTAARTSLEKSLLGMKQLLHIPLTDSLALSPPPLVALRKDTPYYFAGNPSEQLAKLHLQSAELDVMRAKRALYPTLRFSGGYGTNYSSERRNYLTGDYMPFGDQINENRSLYFGLSLSIPILNNFSIRSNMARAKTNLNMQQIALEKVQTEQQKIALEYRKDYEKSLEEDRAIQVQRRTAHTTYQAMKERYDVGFASALDYNRSLLDFNLAELNSIKSKYAILYYQEVIKVLRY